MDFLDVKVKICARNERGVGEREGWNLHEASEHISDLNATEREL